MGHSLVSIQYYENRGIEYTIAEEYYTGPRPIKLENIINSYSDIKERIKRFAKGKDSEKTEKIFQQRIVSETNKSKISNWYCLDIEYIQEGTPFGRIDIIAISKQKKEEKFKIALVELKVGEDSIRASLNDVMKSNKQQYDNVHETPHAIYNHNNMGLKYKSGIVGHLVDYFRYLYTDGDIKMLRCEIPLILNCQEKFGIDIPKEIRNIKSTDLDIHPEVIFLCYTDPDLPKKQTPNHVKKITSNHIFHGDGKRRSKFALQALINKEDISGFLNSETKEAFSDNTKDIVSLCQDINDSSYNFNFIFVDSADDNCWLSLDRLVLK